MDYTIITLAALGLLGILMNNLKSMNAINKRNDGKLNIKQYLKVEIFSILLSVCFVSATIVVSQEIKQIEIAGKWFGVTVFCVGYMTQSILVFLDGKAEVYLKKKNDEEGVG